MVPTPDHPGASGDAQRASSTPEDGDDPVFAESTSGSPDTTAPSPGTAPRAVLRPVPEGFPTPLPRPARPNRRPALPSPQPGRPRGPLIAALAVIAVMVLTVGIGGSVLAYRALAPDEEPAGGTGPATSDPASPGDDHGSPSEVEIGAAEVRELSTELGVASVGSPTDQVTADGEFVILSLELTNGSGPALILSDWVTLETADGQIFTPHQRATDAHLAETTAYGVVPDDTTEKVHVIFDVPIGAAPVAAHLDLSSGSDSGTGTLPLGG